MTRPRDGAYWPDDLPGAIRHAVEPHHLRGGRLGTDGDRTRHPERQRGREGERDDSSRVRQLFDTTSTTARIRERGRHACLAMTRALAQLPIQARSLTRAHRDSLADMFQRSLTSGKAPERFGRYCRRGASRILGLAICHLSPPQCARRCAHRGPSPQSRVAALEC